MPGRSLDTPWRPTASPRRLGSVSGASRSVLGAPRERPEGRQECPGTPCRAKGCPEAPGIVPRRQKSVPSRVRGLKHRVFSALRVREAVSERFFVDVCRFPVFFAKCEMSVSYHACQQKQRVGPSRCEFSRSPTATSKNLENRPENRPEIVENRVSERLGRPFRSTLVARSSSVERLGATRGDSSDSASHSERPSRSKWVARGRSGRPGRVGSPKTSGGNSNRDNN